MNINHIMCFVFVMVALPAVRLCAESSRDIQGESVDEPIVSSTAHQKTSLTTPESWFADGSLNAERAHAIIKETGAALKRGEWFIKPVMISALALLLVNMINETGDDWWYERLFLTSHRDSGSPALIYNYKNSWAARKMIAYADLQHILLALGLIVGGLPLIEAGLDRVFFGGLLSGKDEKKIIEKKQHAFEALVADAGIEKDVLAQLNPSLQALFNTTTGDMTTTHKMGAALQQFDKRIIRYITMLCIGYVFLIQDGVYDRLFDSKWKHYKAQLFNYKTWWGDDYVSKDTFEALLTCLILAPLAYWIGEYLAQASDYEATKLAGEFARKKQDAFEVFGAQLSSEKDAWTEMNTNLKDMMSTIRKDMTMTDKIVAALKPYAWLGKRTAQIGTMAALLLAWNGTSRIWGIYDYLFYTSKAKNRDALICDYDTLSLSTYLESRDAQFLLFCVLGIPLGIFIASQISGLGSLAINELDGSAEKRLEGLKALIEQWYSQPDKIPTLMRPVIEKLHTDARNNILTQDGCDKVLAAITTLSSGAT